MSTHLKIHLEIGTQVSCIKCMIDEASYNIETLRYIQIDFKVHYLNK